MRGCALQRRWVEAQEMAGGQGAGSRLRSSSATWPALQPPETSRRKNQTQTMFEGTVGLVKLVPAQITSGNPFTPALPPLLGRPGHQAGQNLLCAASGPGLPRESGRDGGHHTQARRMPSAGGRTCFTSCGALGSKVWVPDPTCEQFLLQQGSKPL